MPKPPDPPPRRPPARAPTSAEVARLAGVSRTTVSFVLNDVADQSIGAATRAKVQAAALAIGYVPNAAARSLVGGTSNTVALVLPQTSHLYVDAFLAQYLASVNEECHRVGLKLLIESMEGGGRKPGSFVQLVRSRRIDGLIVLNPRSDELGPLRRLRDERIPLVAELPDDLPDSLGNEPALAAQLPVQHLLDLGHRAIAFVNFAPSGFSAVSQREQGWRRALESRGVKADPKLVAHADISAASGYEATQTLLARSARRGTSKVGSPKFSALFAGNDTIAFGALRALREAGLRVPQDVAVVGYDDIPLAAFASPPLTTVRTDPVGHGRRAVLLLLAQMRQGGPAVQVDAADAPRLVVRESCGATLHGAAIKAEPLSSVPLSSAPISSVPIPAPRRRTAR